MCCLYFCFLLVERVSSPTDSKNRTIRSESFLWYLEILRLFFLNISKKMTSVQLVLQLPWLPFPLQWWRLHNTKFEPPVHFGSDKIIRLGLTLGLTLWLQKIKFEPPVLFGSDKIIRLGLRLGLTLWLHNTKFEPPLPFGSDKTLTLTARN